MNRRSVLISLARAGGAAAVAGLVRPAFAETNAAAAGLLDQTYPDLQGKPQALAQWRGKPMLVNFWATWCAPCVKEMPELDALHKSHPGVQFLGVAIDSAVNVAKFTAKVPVSYPLLVSGPGAIDIMRRMGNGPGGLPFTVVLAADGGIRKQTLGPVDISAMEDVLKSLSS